MITVDSEQIVNVSLQKVWKGMYISTSPITKPCVAIGWRLRRDWDEKFENQLLQEERRHQYNIWYCMIWMICYVHLFSDLYLAFGLKADSKEESEQQNSKSTKPDQRNFQRMSDFIDDSFAVCPWLFNQPRWFNQHEKTLFHAMPLSLSISIYILNN